MKKIDPLTYDLDAILAMTGYFEDETAPCGCEWDAYHRPDCPATPIWAQMHRQGWEAYAFWPIALMEAAVGMAAWTVTQLVLGQGS